MAEYFTHISEGCGDKTGQFTKLFTMILSGLIIALTNHPYYALSLLTYIPIIMCVMGAFMPHIISGVG